MRLPLLILCGGLIAAGALVAGRATAPARVTAAQSMSTDAPDRMADKAAMGRIIRDYLMANPEILVEAMQELERKQDSERDNVAQKGITEHQAELMSDPDSPVSGNPNGDVDDRRVQRLSVPLLQEGLLVHQVGGGDRRQGEADLQGPADPGRGLEDRRAGSPCLAQPEQARRPAQCADGIQRPARPRPDHDPGGSVGIDVGQLQKDMDDPKLKQIIDRNVALAGALGVRGTPAFVVGKQFVPGAVDADTLKQLIQDARTRAENLLPIHMGRCRRHTPTEGSAPLLMTPIAPEDGGHFPI